MLQSSRDRYEFPWTEWIIIIEGIIMQFINDSRSTPTIECTNNGNLLGLRRPYAEYQSICAAGCT